MLKHNIQGFSSEILLFFSSVSEKKKLYVLSCYLIMNKFILLAFRPLCCVEGLVSGLQ